MELRSIAQVTYLDPYRISQFSVEINVFNDWQKKRTDEVQGVGNFGPLQEENPRYWGVPTDNGYQGAVEFSCSITSTKNPIRGVLSAREERERKIASDRIIVENYFGMFSTLWVLMGSK